MPFIVGTAGHIDHGKTSLIKALTGQDTDRLKEEKERGISIDLGFAHLDLDDGTSAGVIDVPGHERFIRNMLAGAHGIDLVLFTVAADDGVMPQTVEHLDILHLLGVSHAIFVITKIDLVSAARVAEVEEEIRILVAGTSLEHSAVMPFSFTSGEGLEQLRSRIAQVLQSIKKAPPRGYFRLPVDRVFVLQGHGVVVTGTALQGEVKTGDRIRCLPGDQLFRVRSLQVHGQPVSSATWGQRLALNLTGQEKPSIERGDVLCHEQLTLTSDRFDASLDVRLSADGGVKNHQRVRIHLGTAERLGKVIVLGSQDLVAPGRTAFCQIVISEPLVALRGDHFIIRDETAQRTLGGGIVLHPWPPAHKRREPGLEVKLKTLQAGPPAAVAELFLDERDEFAVPIAPLHQFLNLRSEQALAELRDVPAIKVVTLEGEDVFTTERKWNGLKQALLAALRAFHSTHPLVAGRDMEELRDKLPARVAPKVFRAFVERLETENAIAREGSLLRLPEHTITLRSDEQHGIDRIKALLGASPLMPPDLQQIERTTGIDRAKLIQVMRILERDRSVVRVGVDLFFLSGSLEGVTRTLREEFSERDEITPAMFRDRFNTTRKYAIPLLEYLDREGITVRVGDTRRLRAAQSTARQSS
ncbi:MAG: selenocysteine-specific translation elongation factor [Acidobacteria bacterium]|nr:selenocysteine-specific translation elongation factor [Acidobacteriota bacterium]